MGRQTKVGDGMTLEQELELSYYKDAAPINESHGIWLVQDQQAASSMYAKP